MESFLFERAGVVDVGDYIGGEYAPGAAVQIERVNLTAMAPQAQTVLELVIGGQLSGYQLVVPSGVANTEITACVNFLPVIPVPLGGNGLAASMRWQCVSGPTDLSTALAQVDLVMWVDRLLGTPPDVTPFTGGSLMAPALSEGDTVGQAQELLSEWLTSYFDGNMHMIGLAASGVFPLCAIKFEQSQIQQPLDKSMINSGLPQAEIRLHLMPRTVRRDNWPGGYLNTGPCIFHFTVRASNQGRGQSEYLARLTAGLLKSILNNPANALALAEKGIKHLECRDAVAMPAKDWKEFLVAATGEFSWNSYF